MREVEGMCICGNLFRGGAHCQQGDGIDDDAAAAACCSCARTLLSYSRLSDPTSDDRKKRQARHGTGRPTGTGPRAAAAQAAASNQASTRLRLQPAPAIPAQHVFLLLLPVIHSSTGGLRKARRGEARQGNVRQCKARQGNKAVALSVSMPLLFAPAASLCSLNLLLLARGSTRTKDEGEERAPGLKSRPHAGRTTTRCQCSLYPTTEMPGCVGGSRSSSSSRAWTACSRIIHRVNHAFAICHLPPT